MSIAEDFIAELEQEALSTRISFLRVPDNHLDFKPHEKSMSFSSLMGHIGEDLRFWGEAILSTDVFDFNPKTQVFPNLNTTQESINLFDKNVAIVKEALSQCDDTKMKATWKMKVNGDIVMEGSRTSIFRSGVMSHIIHHRAQLGVYLRLNDLPVPAVYGTSADEGRG